MRSSSTGSEAFLKHKKEKKTRITPVLEVLFQKVEKSHEKPFMYHNI